ncbi:HTH domain-containing protein [Natronolimnobius baerhuensis]|uniref:HTH domain-containing protein n=1 Tax=Natronolimnobius baerhuensis TaxID=253108 RepID=UPI000B403A6E|nr:HTH domain-containing protein [Natronolimnobius baerhuensis]
MSQIDLTNRQRRTLVTLVNKYQQSSEPVTAETLANSLDRDSGTLRNQMQSLKSLQLVEGIPGPRGGYKPTEAAFDVLDRSQLEDAETVVFAQQYERVDTTVDEIDFTSVHHPDLCRAHVRFQRSIQNVSKGDEVIIGPTPLSNLVVAGIIVDSDNTTNTLIIDVAHLKAPLMDGD